MIVCAIPTQMEHI